MFLFFWLPQNTFYRLFYLPGLVIAMGLVLAQWDQSPHSPRRYRLALTVFVLSVWNFLFLIYPQSRVAANKPLHAALRMNAHWSRESVIFQHAFVPDNWIALYVNPDTTWLSFPADRTALEEQIRILRGKGKSVWLDATSVEHVESMQDGRDWLARWAPPSGRHDFATKRHHVRFFRLSVPPED